MPFTVSGSESTIRRDAGTHGAGRCSAGSGAARQLSETAALQRGSHRRQAACGPPVPLASTLTASRTCGCCRRVASISPGSMRWPRSLTCSSRRPRNSACRPRASAPGRPFGRRFPTCVRSAEARRSQLGRRRYPRRPLPADVQLSSSPIAAARRRWSARRAAVLAIGLPMEWDLCLDACCNPARSSRRPSPVGPYSLMMCAGAWARTKPGGVLQAPASH